MTRTIPRTFALLFAATVVLSVSACDSDEASVEPDPDERAASQAEAAELDEPGEGLHGKRGKHGKRNPAARLCAELECSDAQAAQVTELFAQHRPDPDQRADHREARKQARADAHAAIADAFQADEFDPSVLARVAPKPPGDASPREDRMVALAVGLHGILTPEQRAELGDRIAAGRPMLFGPDGKHHGKRGKHGRHGKGEAHAEEAERDPAERIAARVERLCAPLSCSEAQVAQLTAVFTDAHEARKRARAEHAGDKPDLSAVAELMRAETLDEAALRTALAEVRAEGAEHRAERGEHKGELLAEIHAILTPAQRALVADEIRAKGVRAALGKPEREGEGRRGGKRRHRARAGE